MRESDCLSSNIVTGKPIFNVLPAYLYTLSFLGSFKVSYYCKDEFTFWSSNKSSPYYSSMIDSYEDELSSHDSTNSDWDCSEIEDYLSVTELIHIAKLLLEGRGFLNDCFLVNK